MKAPLSAVRKIVTSYGSYKTFIGPFDQSRVLAKRKGTSEVYLQVPILNGAAHIWTVADMSPPTKDGADEVISGRHKRGNVADFRARWRLRAVDEHHTIPEARALRRPEAPLPPSVVTTQLVKAADKAVTAVRNRAQSEAPPGTQATTAASGASPAASDASPGAVTSDVRRRAGRRRSRRARRRPGQRDGGSHAAAASDAAGQRVRSAAGRRHQRPPRQGRGAPLGPSQPAPPTGRLATERPAPLPFPPSVRPALLGLPRRLTPRRDARSPPIAADHR